MVRVYVLHKKKILIEQIIWNNAFLQTRFINLSLHALILRWKKHIFLMILKTSSSSYQNKKVVVRTVLACIYIQWWNTWWQFLKLGFWNNIYLLLVCMFKIRTIIDRKKLHKYKFTNWRYFIISVIFIFLLKIIIL